MTFQVGPRLLAFSAVLVTIATSPTHAAGFDSTAELPKLHVTFRPAAEPASPSLGPIDFSLSTAAALAAAEQAPAVAVEYSEAYHKRAAVHRAASFALLPLFATEGWLGQSIYNNSTPNKKTAHRVVAGAIDGLFGLNTVTGVWNLVEARKDPNGRRRRLVHGILMMASDAGFLATTALRPNSRRLEGTLPSTHRALAITSISMATTGYLIMLFGNR